jgi:endoglucanase
VRHASLLGLLLICAACDDNPGTPAVDAGPGFDASGLVPFTPPPSEDAHVPFGSHAVAYHPESILPSATDRDAQTRSFYERWKATYLRQTCGDGRQVVASETTDTNLTVSEAHGYGMMILALMAGADPDARLAFDGMVYFFRDHPSLNAPDLMAWFQTSQCADAEGADSATDGDLDIAYALLLADRQWGSCDGIDYRAAALAVMTAIERCDVDIDDRYLLLGDWAGPGAGPEYRSTRTSDFVPDHFRSFGIASGATQWDGLTTSEYALFETMRTQYSPSAGLVPDFIVEPAGSPAPAPPGFLETDGDGQYYNNACRVPWRIGTDYVLHGSAESAAFLGPLNAWIQAQTTGDPSRIAAGYDLDGTPLRDWATLAFIAPFGVAAMADPAHPEWLDSIWNWTVAAEPTGYYGDTLKLLAMLVMSGNWWAPESLPDPCTP